VGCFFIEFQFQKGFKKIINEFVFRYFRQRFGIKEVLRNGTEQNLGKMRAEHFSFYPMLYEGSFWLHYYFIK